jgi:lysophospholipid acyltransferase (LPLAT)-like uncharacterized protein
MKISFKTTFKTAFKTAFKQILIYLFTLLIRLWLKSLRDRLILDEREDEAIGAIYAFWHGEQLSLLKYVPRHANAIISLSKDGDLQTELMSHFKIAAIRGSSSKGGMLALRKSLRVLEQNQNLLIAMDGPKGPIYEAKEGVAYLSLISQKHIYFCSLFAHHAIRLKTWDQFLLPYPFSRIDLKFMKIIPPKIKDTANDLSIDDQMTYYLNMIQKITNSSIK